MKIGDEEFSIGISKRYSNNAKQTVKEAGNIDDGKPYDRHGSDGKFVKRWPKL